MYALLLRRVGATALPARWLQPRALSSVPKVSTSVELAQTAEPAKPAVKSLVEPTSSSAGGGPTPPRKKGPGSLFIEWIIDHPRIFFGGLGAAIVCWAVRANVAQGREMALVRMLESEAPLSPREVASLARNNAVPSHIFVATQRVVRQSLSSLGCDGVIADEMPVGSASATMRVLLQLQTFADAAASAKNGGSSNCTDGTSAVNADARLTRALRELAMTLVPGFSGNVCLPMKQTWPLTSLGPAPEPLVLVPARELQGMHMLTRAAAALALQFPVDNSPALATVSTLHTAAAAALRDKPPAEAPPAPPAPPGTWLHGTALEHGLSPTRYASEPLPKHELQLPTCALPPPTGRAANVHALALLALLGATVGFYAPPPPPPPPPTPPGEPKSAYDLVVDRVQEFFFGSPPAATLPSVVPPTAADTSSDADAAVDASAVTSTPTAHAAATAATEFDAEWPSRFGPLPSQGERVALYMALLREFKAGRAAAPAPATAAEAVAQDLAQALVATAAEAVAAEGPPLPSNPHAAEPGSPPPEEIYSAEDVCDLIDLLAATWQLPPRNRIYQPEGVQRQWPLPRQSIKPSPVHLRGALAELKLSSDKVRPLTEIEDTKAAAAAPLPSKPPAPLPWRTWQLEPSGSSEDAATPPLAPPLSALAAGLELASDLPARDATLPVLSRRLTANEVSRIMESRAVCAWGACLWSERDGMRTSSRWLQ